MDYTFYNVHKIEFARIAYIDGEERVPAGKPVL